MREIIVKTIPEGYSENHAVKGAIQSYLGVLSSNKLSNLDFHYLIESLSDYSTETQISFINLAKQVVSDFDEFTSEEFDSFYKLCINNNISSEDNTVHCQELSRIFSVYQSSGFYPEKSVIGNLIKLYRHNNEEVLALTKNLADYLEANGIKLFETLLEELAKLPNRTDSDFVLNKFLELEQENINKKGIKDIFYILVNSQTTSSNKTLEAYFENKVFDCKNKDDIISLINAKHINEKTLQGLFELIGKEGFVISPKFIKYFILHTDDVNDRTKKGETLEYFVNFFKILDSPNAKGLEFCEKIYDFIKRNEDKFFPALSEVSDRFRGKISLKELSEILIDLSKPEKGYYLSNVAMIINKLAKHFPFILNVKTLNWLNEPKVNIRNLTDSLNSFEDDDDGGATYESNPIKSDRIIRNLDEEKVKIPLDNILLAMLAGYGFSREELTSSNPLYVSTKP